MAYYGRDDWDDLGQSILDIVDRAVNSQNYQKLNQTIRQVVSRAVDMGNEAVRRAMDSSSRSSSATADPGRQNARPPTVAGKQDLLTLYGKTGSKTAIGILKIVGGCLVSCLSALALFGIVGYHLLISGTSPLSIPTALSLIVFTLGAGLTYSGAKTLGKIRRYKIYRKTLGLKTYCTVQKLAHSVGKSVKFVRKELRQMIDEGLFLEGHMDKEEACLITNDETYRYYEQSRLQLEERQRLESAARAQKSCAPHNPQVQEVLNRGEAFIAQIRRCNDAIPGQAISEKISRMETIVGRIFERTQDDPEIIPDLKKLMDYYLPMTVKLLNAYADMDAQPIQGKTIQSAKLEIEATLDTLNLAFEKLLDSIFMDTAMDISSDISVLNTLLAQEGLTEDDLSKIKKSQDL